MNLKLQTNTYYKMILAKDFKRNKLDKIVAICMVCGAINVDYTHKCFKNNSDTLKAFEEHLLSSNTPFTNAATKYKRTEEIQKVLTSEDFTYRSDYSLAQLFVYQYDKAKEHNTTCNLSFTKFKKLQKTKRCQYSGVEITKDNFSIDRIDNSLGYTDTNVLVCDVSLNKAKSNLSIEQFKLIYKALKKRKII